MILLCIVWHYIGHLSTLFHFTQIFFAGPVGEVTLVGGSGPHEGNIFVGDNPVCDDHHDAENAHVVCRFAQNIDSFFQ